MWSKVKQGMKHWQFWLRVSILPIIWLFIILEFIGEKGFEFLDDHIPKTPND